MDNHLKENDSIKVRNIISELQKFGGASIKPLILHPMFLNYIKIMDKKLSNMSRTRVRDIVETYCALCNEFYILNHSAKNPSPYFYVPKSRWNKYFLGEKAINTSLDFLTFQGFISITKKRNPKGINLIRMYRINVNKLEQVLREAEQAPPKTT